MFTGWKAADAPTKQEGPVGWIAGMSSWLSLRFQGCVVICVRRFTEEFWAVLGQVWTSHLLWRWKLVTGETSLTARHHVTWSYIPYLLSCVWVETDLMNPRDWQCELILLDNLGHRQLQFRDKGSALGTERIVVPSIKHRHCECKKELRSGFSDSEVWPWGRHVFLPSVTLPRRLIP